MSEFSPPPISAFQPDVPVGASIPPPAAKPSIMPMSALKDPRRLLMAAAGLGGSAGFLFHFGAGPLGINAVIWSVLWLVTILLVSKRESIRASLGAVLLFAVPGLFFAAMLAIRANPALTCFNVTACLVLMLLLIQHLQDADVHQMRLGDLWLKPWATFGGSLLVSPSVVRCAATGVSIDPSRADRTFAIIRGAFLALPVIGLFTLLFANADDVFAHGLEQIGNWLGKLDIWQGVSHSIWVIVVALACAGGIARSILRIEAEFRSAAGAPKLRIGFTEMVVVLVSTIALFGIFLGIQITYLFGGDALVRAVPNLTYADYAHHGFGELNAVALLTLGMTGVMNRFSTRATIRRERIYSGLASALLALTFPLLLSSYARMHSYEAAYGDTEMRLYVDLFLGWLAAGILWSIAILWARRLPGALGVYVCLIGLLFSLNVVNPDATIVRRDLDGYLHGHKFDTDYVDLLSEDATPEILHARDVIRQRKPSDPMADRLNSVLENRADSNIPAPDKWESWNLSRAISRSILLRYVSQKPASADLGGAAGNCTCASEKEPAKKK